MDPFVNHGWTSSEEVEAWSLIDMINTSKTMSDNTDDKNKKHNYIVNALHASFPSKTMKQVSDLYANRIAKMHIMQLREEIHVTGGSPQNVCTVCDLVNCNCGLAVEEDSYSMDDLLEDNFMVQEEENTAMNGNGFSFGCALEDMGTTKMGVVMMEDRNKKVVLENNICNARQFVAPHRRKLWTEDEHRSFLRGLAFYGQGDWKNISKHFVPTRTNIQISSHAQKFFKRLEKAASSGRKRYSINDVRLQDDDPLAANNSRAPCQQLSFTGLNNDSSFSSQAPVSSFAFTNNLAQLQPPSIYNQQVSLQPIPTEQEMMGSVAPVLDVVGNSVPDFPQGSASFSLGHV